MKAFYLTKPKTIEQREIPEPELGNCEVMVKIKSIGVCGSDIHYYETGSIGDFVVEEPLILGHECAGKVVKVGEDVEGLEIGNRVALEPGIPCCKCEYCKTGKYNLCPDIQFMATPPVNGAFVEYISHPSDFVFQIPDNLSYDEAALLEPLSVGIWATEKALLGLNQSVLILGSGPIGLSTLMISQARGLTDITVADIIDERLEVAEELGATRVVNAKESDIVERFARTFDVVFEAAGTKTTINQTVKLAKTGGKVVLIGLPNEQEIPFATPEATFREIEVIGSFRYANTYHKAIDLTKRKEVELKKMISRKFPFSKVEEALKYPKEHPEKCVKVMVNI